MASCPCPPWIPARGSAGWECVLFMLLCHHRTQEPGSWERTWTERTCTEASLSLGLYNFRCPLNCFSRGAVQRCQSYES